MAAVLHDAGGDAPSPAFTPAYRDRAIRSLGQAVAGLHAAAVQTPCRLYAHFDNGWCERWNAEVPDAYQAQGCDDWSEDVPF